MNSEQQGQEQEQEQAKTGLYCGQAVRVVSAEVRELARWTRDVAGQPGAARAIEVAGADTYPGGPGRWQAAIEVATERAAERREAIRAALAAEIRAGLDVIAAQGGSLLPLAHLLVAVTTGVADVAIFPRVATSILEAAGIPPWAVLEEPQADDEDEGKAPPSNLDQAPHAGKQARSGEGSTTGEPPQSVVRPAGNVNNPAEGVGR
jgi:hypothetical protein